MHGRAWEEALTHRGERRKRNVVKRCKLCGHPVLGVGSRVAGRGLVCGGCDRREANEACHWQPSSPAQPCRA